MINSIYTNHEIFLRELISNASDALDKLYRESLTDPSIARGDLGIHITFDQDARILTISDSGIGMDERALDKNLGTIAHSGSREFKDALSASEGSSPLDIIGQFGVGFYSSFMVADKVTVVSRAYGSDEAYRWESNGVDGYTIKPAKREARGTDIILRIRESTLEENLERYLDERSLQGLIRRYSDYIRYPITMEIETVPLEPESPDAENTRQPEQETITEVKVINSMIPLWTRKKTEVSPEEYNEFYKANFHDTRDPLRTISVHAEGTSAYDALLFIPRELPEPLYGKDFERGLALYSSNVLITDACAKLVPDYYGFVRGVVDSKDLNLNVSRETLQQDYQLEIIEQHLEKKITSELENMRDHDRASYSDFFDNFGNSLKFAIYASHGVLTEVLHDLLLYYSAKEHRLITLAEYVEAAKDAEAVVIYYATGTDTDRLAKAPSVRTVLDRGHDVLLCPGGVQDEFCFMTMGSYKGSDFLNVASGNVNMGDAEEQGEAEQANKDNADLFNILLEHTPPSITRVVTSTRFTDAHDTASCVTTDGAITLAMAKLIAARPDRKNAPQPTYLLEINTHHALFAGLQAAHGARDDERVKNYATVLLNQAFLAEDLPIDEPLAFNAAMNALMT
jgi:molecular chaperone HtpG